MSAWGRLGGPAREWWLVLVLASALLAIIVQAGLVSRLDHLVYDGLQRRMAEQPGQDILIVAIDDRAIQEAGAWPWPRERVARLVAAVADAAPRAIVLDLLLTDPRDAAGDKALAAAISGAGNVYLPVRFAVPGVNGAGYAVVRPFAPFSQAAAGLGQVNVVPDHDGLLRRFYLHYGDGRERWPAIALTVARDERPTPLPDAAVRGELMASDGVLVPFAGPAGSYATVSAAAVLRGEVPPSILRGRHVMIGSTASGLGDAYATPAGIDGSLMRGVEIQANLLDALLRNRQIIQAGRPATLALAFLPLLLMMLALRFLRPRWTLPITAALVALVLGGSFTLLLQQRFWLPPGAALVGVLLVYPVWTWRRLAFASRYLDSELERTSPLLLLLEQERTVRPGEDALDRQVDLLSRVIRRERNLARFLNDRLMQMPDAVLVTGTDGAVVFANTAAQRLFTALHGASGITTADDLLGRLYLTQADARQPIAFADIRSDRPWQADAETRRGQSFDVRVEPQRDSLDALVGYVIRVVDMTETVAAQRRSSDALQLLSHDMRAPQASILSYLDNVATSEVPRPIADRIRTYARQTLKLADDFVHLARAETVEMEIEVVDMVQLAMDAADALWPQASARQIRIDLDTLPEELLVRGCASLLSRTLVNLVDNAVKFSPPAATVSLHGQHVERPAPLMPLIRLSVSNAGPGIPPDRLALLYQRFQSTSPAATGGVGLGLAFVHTVAVRHGGEIRCATAEAGPTVFTIELPALADPDQNAAPGTIPQAASALPGA